MAILFPVKSVLCPSLHLTQHEHFQHIPYHPINMSQIHPPNLTISHTSCSIPHSRKSEKDITFHPCTDTPHPIYSISYGLQELSESLATLAEPTVTTAGHVVDLCCGKSGAAAGEPTVTTAVGPGERSAKSSATRSGEDGWFEKAEWSDEPKGDITEYNIV